MSNEEIFDAIIYELTFSNGVKLTGPLDKVSNHLTDFDDPKMVISRNQPESIKSIVDEYHSINDVTPIKFEDFLANR